MDFPIGRSALYGAPPAWVSGAAWYGSLIPGLVDGSGYIYQRHRYLDPNTGLFAQEDPIGLAGGLNLYGFAGGDPVNYADPFGLSPQTCPPVCVLPGPAGAGAGAAAATAAATNSDVIAAGLDAAIDAARDKLAIKYVTYTRVSPSGQVYSGRTSGWGDPRSIVKVRAAGHPARLSGFSEPTVDAWATGAQGYAAIRGREQQLIDAHGGAQKDGGTSANLIRGVSTRNPLAGYFETQALARFGPVLHAP